MHSRREFFALSASLALAATSGTATSRDARRPSALRGTDVQPAHRPPTSLSILILGGTRFLGPALVAAGLGRGHRVAMFNRGRTEVELGTRIPDAVERLVGDRDPRVAPGLSALKGRTWDAVIDTSGLFPRHVTASAILLRDAGVPHYIYVSSISAYDNARTPRADESDPPVDLENPYWEEADEGFVYTGELKRPCEIAVQRIFADRAFIVRPTYMVGPGDVTGRFTYWPVRVREAVADRRRMLVPGRPGAPIQVVDARDVADWLIHAAETRLTGLFNACGPARPHTFGDVLSACEGAVAHPSPPDYAWVTWDFAREHRIPFPIILPDEGEFAGFHTRVSARAIAAGLAFRPLGTTARDILAWYDAQPADRQAQCRGRLTPDRERELLALWDAR